uniref:Lipoprotein n=1 Tax=Arundo donax TaxID=35708 RepID=A0A0A8ZAA1_ARUDO
MITFFLRGTRGSLVVVLLYSCFTPEDTNNKMQDDHNPC